MEQIGSVLDRVLPAMMESIKNDCLSKPFTPSRSITVDQICYVQDLMDRAGRSFVEAVRELQG